VLPEYAATFGAGPVQIGALVADVDNYSANTKELIDESAVCPT
jgi:hypothetical protein